MATASKCRDSDCIHAPATRESPCTSVLARTIAPARSHAQSSPHQAGEVGPANKAKCTVRLDQPLARLSILGAPPDLCREFVCSSEAIPQPQLHSPSFHKLLAVDAKRTGPTKRIILNAMRIKSHRVRCIEQFPLD